MSEEPQLLKHPGILFGGFLALATLSVMNSAYSNVVDAIKLELSLTYTQTGALMSAYFVGYALGQIPWGVLADRNGSRPVMAASILGVSASTILFGLSGGYLLALATRFLAGLLGAGVFVPGVRLVSSWFTSKERGTALGILNIGGSTGLIVASWAAPLLALSFGWRLSMEVFGCVGVLNAAIIWLSLRDRNVEASRKSENNPIPFKERGFWVLAFTQFIRLGGYYTFIAWLPLLLREEYGFNLVATGTALSLFNLAGILANPLGGVLSDRVGEKPVLLASFLLMALNLLVFTRLFGGPLVFGAVLLLGWFINFIRSPVFTIIPRLFGTEAAGSISGVHNTFASFGALLLPLSLGFIRDYTLSYELGWIAVAVLMVVTSGLVAILRIPSEQTGYE